MGDPVSLLSAFNTAVAAAKTAIAAVRAVSRLPLRLFTSRRHPRDLRLVPHQPWCYWRPGDRNGVQGMLLQAQFHATNTGPFPLRLVAVRLHDPPLAGTVSVRQGIDGPWSDYRLEPNHGYAMANVHFFLAPPVRARGESFVADVVIVDNLGNEHRCRRVAFTGR